MRKITLLLCIATAIFYGCAEKSRDIPTELFGVKVGEIYKIGEGTKENFGTLPIKKMRGTEVTFGIGYHLYFEPLKENKAFSYKEMKKNPTDEYFTTSHHLYFLPILPTSIKTEEQLNVYKLEDVEIATIDWSDYKENEESAYFWISDICKTFSADIAVKGEFSDDYKNKFYSCKFKNKERQLEANNLGNMVIVRLGYDKETLDKKTEAIDTFVRKIKAKDLLK
jgi:hypothetical protein